MTIIIYLLAAIIRGNKYFNYVLYLLSFTTKKISVEKQDIEYFATLNIDARQNGNESFSNYNLFIFCLFSFVSQDFNLEYFYKKKETLRIGSPKLKSTSSASMAMVVVMFHCCYF